MSDGEVASPPFHDTSKATYPPILYLEQTLTYGLIGGIFFVVLGVIAMSDGRFGGTFNAALRLICLILAAGLPGIAIAVKIPVDDFAAKGYMVDTGDGIVRNVKLVERREPLVSVIRRPLENEQDRKLLDPEGVKTLETRMGRPLKLGEDMLDVHSEFFPFHLGGHDFVHAGADGIDFYHLGSWVEKDGVLLRGQRPQRRRGDVVPIPGEFSANGKLIKMRQRTWPVTWRWVPEMRGPSINGEPGPILRKAHYDPFGLPDTLLRYLETNDYAKMSGATPSHATRTTWYGRVPPLYRGGFVRIAYTEYPPMDERGARHTSEDEKIRTWGTEGALRHLQGEFNELAQKYADVSLQSQIGHSAVYGQPGGVTPYGTGQRPG